MWWRSLSLPPLFASLFGCLLVSVTFTRCSDAWSFFCLLPLLDFLLDICGALSFSKEGGGLMHWAGVQTSTLPHDV
jgi:hypothetical protein